MSTNRDGQTTLTEDSIRAVHSDGLAIANDIARWQEGHEATLTAPELLAIAVRIAQLSDEDPHEPLTSYRLRADAEHAFICIATHPNVPQEWARAVILTPEVLGQTATAPGERIHLYSDVDTIRPYGLIVDALLSNAAFPRDLLEQVGDRFGEGALLNPHSSAALIDRIGLRLHDQIPGWLTEPMWLQRGCRALADVAVHPNVNPDTSQRAIADLIGIHDWFASQEAGRYDWDPDGSLNDGFPNYVHGKRRSPHISNVTDGLMQVLAHNSQALPAELRSLLIMSAVMR